MVEKSIVLVAFEDRSVKCVVFAICQPTKYAEPPTPWIWDLYNLGEMARGPSTADIIKS